MFDYFFKQMDNMGDWTIYYDEPTRKVKYKYEDGLSLVSCMCEAVIEAPMINLIALFCEVDQFHTWFPSVTSCTIAKEVTPIRGLYSVKQAMPWPLWPRDMIF